METFSALLALCAENSLVTGEFPSHRPVTRSFDVFFHLRLNKRYSKHSWGWWFETPSCSLWRHCNESIGHQWIPIYNGYAGLWYFLCSTIKNKVELRWFGSWTFIDVLSCSSFTAWFIITCATTKKTQKNYRISEFIHASLQTVV